MREQLADKHIRGRGIEIGGAHYALRVPQGAKVSYVDRMPLEELRQQMNDVTIPDHEIIVDDAEKLEKFAPNSLDFIIANHVFEHCEDPLGTLRVWHDRLRKDGILYAAVPEKTKTFDRDRKITRLSHLVEDHEQYKDFKKINNEDHYREWFTLIENRSGEDLEKCIKGAEAARTNIHFHVWDIAAMREIFHGWAQDLFDVLECGDNGAEIIWILKKK